MKASWQSIVLLIAMITLCVWQELPSHYHQERGVYLLIQAVQAEAEPMLSNNWHLLPDPLTRREARMLTKQAAEHFQAATFACTTNFRAHRWTGRTHLLLDNPEQAAEALAAYTNRCPEDTQGWWELALAYQMMEQALKDSTYWSPSSGLDISRFSSIVNSKTMTVSLQSAEMEMSYVLIEMPCCKQEETLQFGFMSPMDLEALNTSRKDPLWTPEKSVRRQVLFMQPPSQAVFTVTLPVTPTAMTFWMGIAPEVKGGQDEVVYRVAVDSSEIYTHVMTTEQAQGSWQPAQVDLTAWAGREMHLTLAIDLSPVGDGQGDWAGWRDMRLLESDKATYALTDPAWQMCAAWDAGGFTAQDLTAAGDKARKTERYREALWWYERAAEIEPGLSDPWYYIGLAYEGMGEWMDALEAYELAVNTDAFITVGRSSPYYRMGEIYQQQLVKQQVESALAAYEAAIKLGDFDNKWEISDCHYERGRILQQMGMNPAKYMAEYQRAIKMNPEHASAHVHLGLAYYTQYKDVERAEAEIKLAIELTQNKWAYYHLGEIYRQKGRKDEAKMMYKQALEIDPTFKMAQNRLRALQTQ